MSTGKYSVAERRRRLTFFLPDLRGGGAERTVLGLAGALASDADVEVVLAGPDAGEFETERPPGVRLTCLGSARVLTSVPRLARHLRRRRPDAVLSGLNHANIVAVAARAMAGVETRLVVVEHNTLSAATQHATSRRDRLMPKLIGWAYPRADAVVAVSAGVADDLAASAGLERSSIEVIPNPVDLADLRRRAARPAGHPWFHDGLGPVALAAGRLVPAKGFDVLLEAVHRARSELPLRLVVLGEGDERAKLENLIARLGLEGAVDLAGFVSDPYPYFAATDLFVLSSRFEGLPTVLLEALALAGRVVATDCPSGPREILDEVGQLDRLVPVDDPAALAEAMVAALDRPPELLSDALGAYDPSRVRERYTAVLFDESERQTERPEAH